jgi:hypothetical protein
MACRPPETVSRPGRCRSRRGRDTAARSACLADKSSREDTNWVQNSLFPADRSIPQDRHDSRQARKRQRCWRTIQRGMARSATPGNNNRREGSGPFLVQALSPGKSSGSRLDRRNRSECHQQTRSRQGTVLGGGLNARTRALEGRASNCTRPRRTRSHQGRAAARQWGPGTSSPVGRRCRRSANPLSKCPPSRCSRRW